MMACVRKLRRQSKSNGFDLVECRFKELKPILEAEQKAEEAKIPEKSRECS
ncbi:hypothetical protein KY290_022389 [Solanum tuberosum]|uniref:Uncharacterized protein n=1 Tax=Solanum tuberosum TaxID=4113 RepID=A0ABQ7V4C1_SOLTU|nr:hypothetical protein KY289_021505 [Solanum tuberosum]KAH0758896.1 hypothetical protein KY290_022389 [Solanum tuberosum]